MNLTAVHLEREPQDVPCQCECGHKHTRKEAKTIYMADISSRFVAMAAEAGISKILWEPNKNGINNAGELIKHLRKVIAEMKAEPARFSKYDKTKQCKWYNYFLTWLESYLIACEAHPESNIRVSR